MKKEEGVSFQCSVSDDDATGAINRTSLSICVLLTGDSGGSREVVTTSSAAPAIKKKKGSHIKGCLKKQDSYGL